tara:strand:+ start:216 stop:566 length:351 start_codon:yes stop_codon:yes gene_type:complete
LVIAASYYSIAAPDAIAILDAIIFWGVIADAALVNIGRASIIPKAILNAIIFWIIIAEAALVSIGLASILTCAILDAIIFWIIIADAAFINKGISIGNPCAIRANRIVAIANAAII